MCSHEFCPIKEGKCITEKPGWEWAEKFGLPSANPTQRRFLIEQSARWGEVVVKEGEAAPNPREGASAGSVPLTTGTLHIKSDCNCGKRSPEKREKELAAMRERVAKERNRILEKRKKRVGE